MIVLGLTGSIGMGKSTTAEMFRDFGVPVQEADAVVHQLYACGGAGSKVIATLAPEAIREDGSVNRDSLRDLVQGDPDLLAQIEAAVHPLVGKEREIFLAKARESGAALAVLDIPLLYETGADSVVDVVAVVSAPESIQRERVLAREGMTADTLAMILARQMPDAEKRARADYVVDSGQGFEVARRQVAAIVESVAQSGERSNAGRHTRGHS